MCDKAVDACLPALKFVTDWFITNRILEKLDNVIFSNYDKDIDDVNSDIIAFFSDGMVLATVNLNNINFDDDNC